LAHTRTPENIVALYHARQTARDPVVRRMEEIRSRYQDEIIVPLPEMDRQERTAVANLLQQGLDHYGRRIASYMPNLDVPPVDSRKETARKRADIRRRATLGWWESNRVPMKLRRRARHLIGYGCTPVVIRPNWELGIPRWEPRDPLGCYPAPMTDPDDLTPTDVIFALKKSLKEIKAMWPLAAGLCTDDEHAQYGDRMLTVLEFEDAEQRSMICLNDPQFVNNNGTPNHVLLDTSDNRTGICNAVVPARITLDRPTGQFDGMLGMMDMQAKMMSLEVIAVQRSIFPDTYLLSRPNEEAKFISGPHAGYTGNVNIVEGGDVVDKSPSPGFMTPQIIDRLERAQRQQGGISAEMGGESASNIRTGRRGDNIMSNLVDFPVQEAQEMLAASLEEENLRATLIARRYFGARPQSFHVQWAGAKGQVDYTPDKDFDSNYTSVSYAQAGYDVQNLTVGASQMVGTGLMSKESVRRMHPWIADADLEGDLITSEGVEAALLQGFQQGLATGQVPPADGARVQELVTNDNLPLFKAILQAQTEAQERQASVTAEGAPDAVDPLSPEAQPGLAGPGMGAEAGVAVQPSGPSLNNLAGMLQDLRSAGKGAA